MGKRVSRDDIAKWVELRKRGHTYKRIGEETGWDPDTVRNYLIEELGTQGKPEPNLELESRAFTMFEQGKSPVDLVKEKVCAIDVATGLFDKFVKIKNEERPQLDVLAARMDNASHLIRCALGRAQMEIHCPVCHNWGHLVLAKINGADRWVCDTCGEIPF